jgi:hypothetical protein
MTEMIVKILVELLSTLAMATKEIRQGKLSESVFGEVLYYLTRCNAEKLVKKLYGEKDIKAVLQRLDRLTQAEAQTTATQTLEVVYGLIQNMREVMESEQMHYAVHLWVLRTLPSRWQCVDRPSKGYPQYVLRVTIK